MNVAELIFELSKFDKESIVTIDKYENTPYCKHTATAKHVSSKKNYVNGRYHMTVSISNIHPNPLHFLISQEEGLTDTAILKEIRSDIAELRSTLVEQSSPTKQQPYIEPNQQDG